MNNQIYDTISTHQQPHLPAILTDNYGRQVTYLRLAITDRCNLRCRYCRPESGVSFIPHEEILSLEELERLVTIFAHLGITKVRVTGGEPFSRRGCVSFLARLKQIEGLEFLHITTNGVKTARYLDELKDIGIAGLNLSLDTLNPQRFWKITRRDFLDSVLQTLHGALAREMPLKINSVVLDDTSDQEVIKLAGLAKQFPITLRFIERMPFSGTARSKKLVNGNLVSRLQRLFPEIEEHKTTVPTTAKVFRVSGFNGRLGVIQGYSRQFCGSCNKVRITPTGMLKTCLYDNGSLDLRTLLRTDSGDAEISNAIIDSILNRYKSGHDAEKSANLSAEPSMANIGG